MISLPNGSESLQWHIVFAMYERDRHLCRWGLHLQQLFARQYAKLKRPPSHISFSNCLQQRLQTQSNPKETKPNKCFNPKSEKLQSSGSFSLRPQKRFSWMQFNWDSTARRRSRIEICQGTWMPLLHAGWPAEPGSHWQIANPANSLKVPVEFQPVCAATTKQTAKQPPSAIATETQTK